MSGFDIKPVHLHHPAEDRGPEQGRPGLAAPSSTSRTCIIVTIERGWM